MFNRTSNLYHNYTGPSSISVVHKRAPTDDSVRLLKEMEDAVIQNIVDSITVNNNEFNCKIYYMRDNLNMDNKYSIVYSLNGNKHVCNITIPQEMGHSNEIQQKQIKLIHSALAEDIASQILMSSVNLTEFNHLK